LRHKPKDVPVTILGAGSNILIRDGGVEGVVIRLSGKGFGGIQIDGMTITVGGAALDRAVALSCIQSGIGGLEFLVGIPGAMGGAVRMNAGAYGTELKDVFQWADVVDPNGVMHRLLPEELNFSYRHSDLPEGWIVVQACLKGFPKEPAEIERQVNTFLTEREASQPVRGRTGGSTFKNPEGHKAWALIDAAGCRGLRQNGAEVSEKHCNFLLNTGEATAADLESLGETVRQRVLENSGVSLQWEIIRLGKV
jgi:UDP-N-acetylmuramate dehydrogenase